MLDAFHSAVVCGGHRPFLIYFDSELTFGEVDRQSDAFAVALADKGFVVHGADVSPRVIETLSQGRSHIFERRS